MIDSIEKTSEGNTIRRVKHKGGRPLQKIKRDLILRIRLSPSESFLIKAKAREAGMRSSTWIRSAAKGARIAPRWTPEEMQTLRMLSGMANNLNQLARQANSGQLFFIARKCEGLLTEIDGTLKYLTNMMGKIAKSGKSFKGCVQYCMLKDKASLLYAEGVRAGEIKHTIADFNMQRKLNPNLGQAVGHIALNWSPEDAGKLSDEKMIEIAQAYLLKMKVRDTQVLMVRHHDAKHPHLHIVYNRVNHQGKTIPDSFQRELNVKVSKALTLQYGFHIGQGKEQVNRPQLKGADKIKYELYDAIKGAIPKVRSMEELEQLLQKQGIGIQYKYKGGTNEVQGISFSKNEYTFKGSKIDRSLSFGKISECISQQVLRGAELQVGHSLADQLRKKLMGVRGEMSVTVHAPEHHGKSFLSALLEAQHIAEPGHDQDDSIFRRKKRKKQGASQDQSQGVSR